MVNFFLNEFFKSKFTAISFSIGDVTYNDLIAKVQKNRKNEVQKTATLPTAMQHRILMIL